MEPSPTRQITVARGYEYHDAAFLNQGSIPEIQQPVYELVRKDAIAEVFRHGVPNFPKSLSHLGLPCLCPRSPPAGSVCRDTYMGTKCMDRSLSWTCDIIHRVSGPIIEHQNGSCLPPVPCGLCQHNIHCESHEEGHSNRKLEKPGRGALRYCYALVK